MLSTKEAEDFFNSKFIFKKYNLNIDKSDDIAEIYGIVAYPTFIFVDGEGEEYSRMVGGARTTKEFLERVTKATEKENSWGYRNARFKSDPLYILEHMQFVNNSCSIRELEKLNTFNLTNRDATFNFNEANIKFYKRNIRDLESPVIQYMVNNKKEVAAIMGEDKYNSFITEKTNGYIYSRVIHIGNREDSLKKAAAIIDKNKNLQTSFYKFITEIIGVEDFFKKALKLGNEDFNTIMKVANKYNKRTTAIDDRKRIIYYVQRAASDYKGAIYPEYKDDVVKFLKKSISYEKNTKEKETYISRLAFIIEKY